MKSKYRYLSVLLLLLFFDACSQRSLSSLWIRPNQDSIEDKKPVTVIEVPEEVQDADLFELSSNEEEESVLELVWLVPEGMVTKYLLTYGFDPNNVSTKLEVSVSELQSSVHPKHGQIYKYLLRGIPSGKKVYYKLQAGNIFGYSEPTEIVKERSK